MYSIILYFVSLTLFYFPCRFRFYYFFARIFHPPKRKRYVYVVHCPEAQNFRLPLTIDPSGTWVRPEGLGGNFLCGRSPSKVSITPAYLL